MITVLIDGDWILYTAGFAGQKTEYVALTAEGFVGPYDGKRAMNEDCPDPLAVYSRTVVDPVDHILHTAKRMILTACEQIAEHYHDEVGPPTIYLDGKGNFRDEIATIRPYKGNREHAKKPEAYGEIKQYLLDNYNCRIADGIESDDLIAIDATALSRSRRVVIVGVDKDLLQVPGHHFNPNKGHKVISKAEGMGRLYRQAISGDAVDNIAGAYRMGATAARKAIKPGMSACAMWQAVVAAYQHTIDKYPDQDLYNGLDAEGAALENMRLVYLLRQHDGYWQPPTID